jgi:predicted branched-subunit amino acid permease
MTSAERKAFRDGVLAGAPLTVGVLPWGIVAGVAMTAAGLSDLQAAAMSLLVFSGAAQLAVLPLLSEAPLWIIYLTALVVSLRYVIYSAMLAPHFEHLPARWRAALSFVTVDGIFALFIGRYQPHDRDPCKHWFYLGASLVMYAVWQVTTWVGIFTGAAIPAEWSLGFAATLALIAILVPLLQDRAVVAGALAAGAASVLLAGAPLKLGVLAAIAVGLAAGLAAARLSKGGANG